MSAQQFPEYPGWETVRILGSGNFGAVYEIERDLFGKKERAALKKISIPQSEGDIDELYSNGFDDASINSHFKDCLAEIVREYTLMADMKGHTNVVYCDDIRYVQKDDGFGWDIYIKMELLTPLMKALPGTVSEEQAVKLGCDLCSALVLCRSRNIIHRDIKPQNIFASKDGDFKLGDFGIAKTAEKTCGGTKIGTYNYMAPEVYNNQPYGHAADLYSLGLVLYWLLNDRRLPFYPAVPAVPRASDMEQARLRRFRGDPIPAPAHGSEALKRIVLKACAYDPKDRYQSADEMLRDLETLNGRSDSTGAQCPSGGLVPQEAADLPELTVSDTGAGARLESLNKNAADMGSASSGEPAGAERSCSPSEETVGLFGIRAGSAASRTPVSPEDGQTANDISPCTPTSSSTSGEEAAIGAFGKPSPVSTPAAKRVVEEAQASAQSMETARESANAFSATIPDPSIATKSKHSPAVICAAVAALAVALVLLLMPKKSGPAQSAGSWSQASSSTSSSSTSSTSTPSSSTSSSSTSSSSTYSSSASSTSTETTPAPVRTPAPTPEPRKVYTRDGILQAAKARAASSAKPIYVTVSDEDGTALQVPEDRFFLSEPYQMKAYPNKSSAEYIFIMPKPEANHGILGILYRDESVTILAETGGFCFFVTEDGRAGWNGSKYFVAP